MDFKNKNKIIKFGAIGFLNLIIAIIIQYFFVLLFIEILGSFITALIVGFLNISFSFITNKLIVFKTSIQYFFKEYLKHILANIILIVFLSLIFYILIDILYLSYFLAIILNSMIGIFLSFIINFFYTFKH